MKTFTLDEVTDKIVGKIGTENRGKFEHDLQMDLIGNAIKETRKERKLTQEDLGKLIEVQNAQISRLENNASNATIDTLMQVFSALKAIVDILILLGVRVKRKRLNFYTRHEKEKFKIQPLR